MLFLNPIDQELNYRYIFLLYLETKCYKKPFTYELISISELNLKLILWHDSKIERLGDLENC